MVKYKTDTFRNKNNKKRLKTTKYLKLIIEEKKVVYNTKKSHA